MPTMHDRTNITVSRCPRRASAFAFRSQYQEMQGRKQSACARSSGGGRMLLLGISFLLLCICWSTFSLVQCRAGRSLRLFGRPPSGTIGTDKDAKLVRLNVWNALDPRQDSRGWLLDPLTATAKAGLSGGATDCRAVHVGEIQSGETRANHRHHFCNETFIIWNARAVYRLENKLMDKGYAQAVVEREDVSVCTAPAHQAHALVNVDPRRTLFLLACEDGIFDAEKPMTDYKVWKDL